MLVAGFLGDDIAETRFPHFAVERGRAQGRLGKTGLAQQLELLAADLLAAQFRRVDRVRIDQDGRDPGASQHRCRRGAGETAADDCDIRVAHARASDRTPYLCAARSK